MQLLWRTRAMQTTSRNAQPGTRVPATLSLNWKCNYVPSVSLFAWTPGSSHLYFCPWVLHRQIFSIREKGLCVISVSLGSHKEKNITGEAAMCTTTCTWGNTAQLEINRNGPQWLSSVHTWIFKCHTQTQKELMPPLINYKHHNLLPVQTADQQYFRNSSSSCAVKSVIQHVLLGEAF